MKFCLLRKPRAVYFTHWILALMDSRIRMMYPLLSARFVASKTRSRRYTSIKDRRELQKLCARPFPLRVGEGPLRPAHCFGRDQRFSELSRN